MEVSIKQLQALDAVVKHGSVQAAASYLNKTHPSVIRALKKMEQELGFDLFDRSGYRSKLTSKGRDYYLGSQRVLYGLVELENRALHLKQGEETTLNIVIGDVTPMPETLALLREFSEKYEFTRLNLLFENIYGPNERLLSGEADLIIHFIDKTDPRYEFHEYCIVPIIPVVAPGFLSFPVTNKIKHSDLTGYTQCVISDTAKGHDKKNYFVMEDSPQITVGDQHTKKEVIKQRMAWGHMPLSFIKEELESGELISIKGEHLKGSNFEIFVTRLVCGDKGVMAERLWKLFVDRV